MEAFAIENEVVVGEGIEEYCEFFEPAAFPGCDGGIACLDDGYLQTPGSISASSSFVDTSLDSTGIEPVAPVEDESNGITLSWSAESLSEELGRLSSSPGVDDPTSVGDDANSFLEAVEQKQTFPVAAYSATISEDWVGTAPVQLRPVKLEDRNLPDPTVVRKKSSRRLEMELWAQQDPEIARKLRRMDQNRRAAANSRERNRNRAAVLESRIYELTLENENLRRCISSLSCEVLALKASHGIHGVNLSDSNPYLNGGGVPGWPVPASIALSGTPLMFGPPSFVGTPQPTASSTAAVNKGGVVEKIQNAGMSNVGAVFAIFIFVGLFFAPPSHDGSFSGGSKVGEGSLSLGGDFFHGLVTAVTADDIVSPSSTEWVGRRLLSQREMWSTQPIPVVD